MPPRKRRRRAPSIRSYLTWAGWALLCISILVGLAAVKSRAGALYVLFGAVVGALALMHLLPSGFRLTWAGWAFLGISTLVGLAAARSQAGLLYVIFGGLMGALHVSVFAARRIVAAVSVRREAPSRAWQHQTVHLGYYLRNTRRRSVVLDLAVEELPAEDVDAAGGYCVHLPPRAVFRAAGRLAPHRRGRLRLPGFRVRTNFPFGLVAASKSYRQAASLLVWPAKGRLKARLLQRGATEISPAAPSPATGGQDEFFGLREYRPDDNPRWIHWRRSATRTTPVVREMSRPLPEVLWIVLDTYLKDTSKARHDARERMIRFAATLIDQAFARGYQVGLALAYRDGVATYAPAAGRGQRCTVLDALAVVDTNTSRPIEETIGALRPGQLRQAQVTVVVAEAGNTRAAAGLRRLCRHFVVVREDTLAEVFEDAPRRRLETIPCR